MRITEIVNAESILGLWKVISDTTWATIDQQVQAQAYEKRERAANAKSRKSSSAKKSGSYSPPKSAKPPTPMPAPAPTPAPVPKQITTNKAQPKTADAMQQAPTAAGYPAPQPQPVPRPGSRAVAGLSPSPAAVPGQLADPDEQKPKLKAIAGGMTTS
jgi:hypothetical protein